MAKPSDLHTRDGHRGPFPDPPHNLHYKTPGLTHAISAFFLLLGFSFCCPLRSLMNYLHTYLLCGLQSIHFAYYQLQFLDRMSRLTLWYEHKVRLSVCLSVRKVYCGKTAAWIRMPFRMVSGVGRGMGVLNGSIYRRRGRSTFGVQFGASHCN